MTRYLRGIEPKRVPLFAAATVALVAAALVLYVVLPFAKSYRAALAERATLERDTAGAAAVVDERIALQADVSALVAQTADGSPWRSPAALASGVIARMQEIAARHAVDLVAIEPSLGKRVGPLQENVFEVELVGDYGDVVAYLRDTRVDPAPIVVREISLAPLDDAPEPRIRATLVAAAFGDAQ
jgi:hypothetical protein